VVSGMRYKLFFVSESGRYLRSLEVESDADASAIHFVERFESNMAMVLWHQDRMVKVFPKITRGQLASKPLMLGP